jgi:DNA-binding NarL/FixJ family response regulator
MPKLRVFLADDHTVVRAGLTALVDAAPDMQVVGEAVDGQEAVASAPTLAPDVAVLDVSMPGLDGAEAARRLKAVCPRLKILALTIHEERSHMSALLAAGATGYLLKCAAAHELLGAIRAVAAGGTYLDPRVAGKMVQPLPEPAAFAPSLSRRETEVLRLVARGHSHREISRRLEVSLKTIETYKARSMEKLRLQTRVDIVRHAEAAGWLRET